MTETQLAQTYAPFISASFEDEERVLINHEGIVLSSNNKLAAFSLKKGQDLLTQLAPYIPEIAVGRFQKLALNTAGFQTSFNLQNKDEVFSFYRILFTPLAVSSKTGFLVQIQNISEHKKTEAKYARQLARMENEMMLRTQEIMHTKEIVNVQGGYLSIFLRGLRHDLKSPVTQLKEIIQYYKKTENPKKKIQAAELIDNCLEKLTNTSRGFSDFVDLHFLPKEQLVYCNFDSLFQDVLLLLKKEILDAKAQIQIDFTAGDQVCFNEKELTSIVYNILSNAIKFRKLDEPLIIKVFSKDYENERSLIVVDNGIGMDLEKYKSLLFAPFKRLNMDRPGAGIGLSLVKNILERNESTIDIESKLDSGTTVEIKFKKPDS